MKKRFYLVVIAFFATSFLYAQQTMLTVGSEVTTLEEFEAIFMKNHPSSTVTKQELDEYIDLFIKFKLKVKQAKELGMDTTSQFRQELEMYRRQLAVPYLKMPEVEERLLKEAYERLKSDYKVRQILVKVDACASPADTLAAYKKMETIRKEVLKSKNFSETAKKYSEDSVTAVAGGLIGWMTALQSAYQFENAFVKLKSGEVSPIIRTSQGYHILSVDATRPAVGNVKVSHIFISANPDNSESYNLAKTRIDEAYSKLLDGEDFALVCKMYSEDYNTNQTGGTLPVFGIREKQPYFEEKAFALTKSGEFTKPFESPLGFHIIKLEEKVSLPDYETLQPELLKKVQKTNRWNQTMQVLVDSIKASYGYTFNQELWNKIQAVADQNGGTVTKSYLKGTQGWLFKTNTREFPIEDFVAATYGKLTDEQVNLCSFRKVYVEPYINNKLVEFKESNLEKEDPKFLALMNEYRDGILLFNLMDKKVWTKSVEDTTGLKQFYEANKYNYMWGERADAYLVDCRTDTVEKAARKMAEKLRTGKITKAKFIEKLNKKNNNNIVLSEGLYSKGDSEAIDKTGFAAGVGPAVERNGKLRFAIVKAIQPPQPKLLKEAKGLIISDYQAYLEDQWVKELKAKYPVVLKTEVLYKLVNP